MNATLYIIQHILDSSNNFYQEKYIGLISDHISVSIIRKDAHNTGLTHLLTHYTTMNC